MIPFSVRVEDVGGAGRRRSCQHETRQPRRGGPVAVAQPEKKQKKESKPAATPGRPWLAVRGRVVQVTQEPERSRVVVFVETAETVVAVVARRQLAGGIEEGDTVRAVGEAQWGPDRKDAQANSRRAVPRRPVALAAVELDVVFRPGMGGDDEDPFHTEPDTDEPREAGALLPEPWKVPRTWVEAFPGRPKVEQQRGRRVVIWRGSIQGQAVTVCSSSTRHAVTLTVLEPTRPALFEAVKPVLYALAAARDGRPVTVRPGAARPCRLRAVARTVAGRLGADPEIRATRSETRTVERLNPVSGTPDRKEITTRARDYARASLAVPRRAGNGWRVQWLQLVTWDPFAPALRPLLWAGKGDRVEVRGFEASYTYTTDDGEECVARRFVVTEARRAGPPRSWWKTDEPADGETADSETAPTTASD